MPVIFHDGGGQVPLLPLLPSSSAFAVSSVLLESATSPSSLPSSTTTPFIHTDVDSDPAPRIDTVQIHHDPLDEASRVDSLINPISYDIYSAELNRLYSDTTSLANVDNSTSSMLGARGCLPVTIVSTIFSFFTISFFLQRFGPSIAPPSEKAEEGHWISSSHSWLERSVCSWFGLCGLTHLNRANWTWQRTAKHERDQEILREQNPLNFKWTDPESFWVSGGEDPESWNEEERLLRDIPDYVFEYAPLIHLFSGEHFWPCDMAEHLIHTTPHLNYTPLRGEADHPNLTNLSDLNRWGRFVYLKSDDNVEERPEWLGGSSNIPSEPDEPDELHESIPNADWDVPRHMSQEEWQRQPWYYAAGEEETKEQGSTEYSDSSVKEPEETDEGEDLLPSEFDPPRHRRSHPRDFIELGKSKSPPEQGGRSDAPCILIVVDKGHGIVDAFWFYFYSYNLGNLVFNVRFGNHVGDWEHSAVRFHHGKPKAVYFSEHNFGRAYTYEAVEKAGKRPVVYSATGTHAMYATAGVHPYVLPWGLLHDVTDRGPLWDPVLNNHAFTYNATSDTIRSSTQTPHAPTEWFYFRGHWGDKFYPLSDPRQYRFAGQYHYVNGPLGPRFKNLGRKKICQGRGDCEIRESRFDILNEGGKGEEGVRRRWDAPRGRGEEVSDIETEDMA